MTAIVIVIAAYFLPTIVAGVRGHRNGPAIFVLNLLTGWTLLGWVWSLGWGMSGNTRRTKDDVLVLTDRFEVRPTR